MSRFVTIDAEKLITIRNERNIQLRAYRNKKLIGDQQILNAAILTSQVETLDVILDCLSIEVKSK